MSNVQRAERMSHHCYPFDDHVTCICDQFSRIIRCSTENGGNEADVTEIVLAATLLIAVILFFFSCIIHRIEKIFLAKDFQIPVLEDFETAWRKFNNRRNNSTATQTSQTEVLRLTITQNQTVVGITNINQQFNHQPGNRTTLGFSNINHFHIQNKNLYPILSVEQEELYHTNPRRNKPLYPTLPSRSLYPTLPLELGTRRSLYPNLPSLNRDCMTLPPRKTKRESFYVNIEPTHHQTEERYEKKEEIPLRSILQEDPRKQGEQVTEEDVYQTIDFSSVDDEETVTVPIEDPVVVENDQAEITINNMFATSDATANESFRNMFVNSTIEESVTIDESIEEDNESGDESEESVPREPSTSSPDESDGQEETPGLAKEAIIQKYSTLHKDTSPDKSFEPSNNTDLSGRSESEPKTLCTFQPYDQNKEILKPTEPRKDPDTYYSQILKYPIQTEDQLERQDACTGLGSKPFADQTTSRAGSLLLRKENSSEKDKSDYVEYFMNNSLHKFNQWE